MLNKVQLTNLYNKVVHIAQYAANPSIMHCVRVTPNVYSSNAKPQPTLANCSAASVQQKANYWYVHFTINFYILSQFVAQTQFAVEDIWFGTGEDIGRQYCAIIGMLNVKYMEEASFWNKVHAQMLNQLQLLCNKNNWDFVFEPNVPAKLKIK